ncbi:MAG: phosphohistidine phosphatase SixA [Thermoprotei archaeon]
MLRLIIVRHGEAEPKVEGLEDKERKLVKKGVKQMRRVAEFLDHMDYKVDRVVSSPYVRAYQSAEAIVEELGEDLKIETIPELEPEVDPAKLLEKIKALDQQGAEATVVIVGHEPQLSAFIKLVTGADVEMKKGGVAVIEFDPNEGKGKLELLVTQKLLKGL